MKKYKEYNGTFYRENTPQAVINVLEHAREHKYRITLDYGDVNTGVSWGEEYDISGYIGRSTGAIKIPLLIKNSRSRGGGGIPDDCIIGIRYANKKDGGVLYSLKKF